MLTKHLLPLVSEPPFIPHLIRLDADTSVGAVRNTLKMRHYRERLIHHAMAKASDRKAQIRVLVVSWREVLVETAQLLPKFARHHQGSCRTVVHFPRIIELGVLRMLATAPVPS